MNNSEQGQPLISSNYGLLKVEYRTNFDDLLNFDGNRCYYQDVNEAIKHGYTAKQANEFNRRVVQMENSIAQTGVAKATMLSACEYDGRFFITDGQGRRAALDNLNANRAEGQPKYGIHVAFFHVKDADELLEEIIKANAIHHAWTTESKMQAFSKLAKDGNVKIAYDTIQKKIEELQTIIPNSISLCTLYEGAFGDASRWNMNYAEKCTFNSPKYWKYFLGFVDNVLKPFLESLKKNYNSTVGIDQKKQLKSLTQQKALRSYIQLFKNLEKWCDVEGYDINTMRKTLIEKFVTWGETITIKDLNKINFKSAKVTNNIIYRQIAEQAGSDRKYDAKVNKYLKYMINEADK